MIYTPFWANHKKSSVLSVLSVQPVARWRWKTIWRGSPRIVKLIRYHDKPLLFFHCSSSHCLSNSPKWLENNCSEHTKNMFGKKTKRDGRTNTGEKWLDREIMLHSHGEMEMWCTRADDDSTTHFQFVRNWSCFFRRRIVWMYPRPR